jgi:hypothetical protein
VAEKSQFFLGPKRRKKLWLGNPNSFGDKKRRKLSDDG